MSLAEAAGAAYAGNSSSNSATQAAGSFTPTAGTLLVAIGAFGNGNGVTATGLTIADTFSGTASGSWTILEVFASGGGGIAGVWCKDAGSSPGAGVVTITAAPSTVYGGVIIVRQFTGAAPAASQNGATGSNSGTVDTVPVTPAQTGSQIVGGYGSYTTGAATANAATAFYGQTAGNAGSEAGLFEGSALTVATVAQVLGFSATKAGSGLAAAEIVPAAPAGITTSPVWATAYDTTAVSGTGSWSNPASAEGTGGSGGPWATWTAP